jgi:hypothetical protein
VLLARGEVRPVGEKRFGGSSKKDRVEGCGVKAVAGDGVKGSLVIDRVWGGGGGGLGRKGLGKKKKRWKGEHESQGFLGRNCPEATTLHT